MIIVQVVDIFSIKSAVDFPPSTVIIKPENSVDYGESTPLDFIRRGDRVPTINTDRLIRSKE